MHVSRTYGIAIRNKMPLLRANADSFLPSVEVDAVALHMAHCASTNMGEIKKITTKIERMIYACFLLI